MGIRKREDGEFEQWEPICGEFSHYTFKWKPWTKLTAFNFMRGVWR